MINFFRKIDNWLNGITMYRLTLYVLIALIAASVILAAIGLLPYKPQNILASAALLVLLCWSFNKIFALFLKVQTNVESAYITALILALIIAPTPSGYYPVNIAFIFWASVWAMASKYVINVNKKHLFNPAAFAVVITALFMNQAANWWVGTASMLPFAIIGGLLIVRKIRRFDVFITFLIIKTVTIFWLDRGVDIGTLLKESVLNSPLVFFGTIMLTEPLTMPPTIDGRIAYAVLVGWLFSPQVHIGSLYFTPEQALLVGNIFVWIISPKARYVFKLKEKKEIGLGIWEFIFKTDRQIKFRPGQYMEWTLGHRFPDSRGNRRYFTLASAPTEQDLNLGVKFYENSSSFKKSMAKMQVGDEIVAAQLAGDFVLPRNPKEKSVFIAGGIGVTPFRSMLKYLVDRNEKRDITLLYINRNAEEIVYQDIMYEAWKKLGINIVCSLTDANNVPPDWNGYTGRLSSEMITNLIPDYKQRTFYISGSHPMVNDTKDLLKVIGVRKSKIKTDFFPGLA